MHPSIGIHTVSSPVLISCLVLILIWLLEVLCVGVGTISAPSELIKIINCIVQGQKEGKGEGGKEGGRVKGYRYAYIIIIFILLKYS